MARRLANARVSQLQDGDAAAAEDPVAADFARAAAALREKLEEQNMCIEDKILK